jgi:hypothetical protein
VFLGSPGRNGIRREHAMDKPSYLVAAFACWLGSEAMGAHLFLATNVGESILLGLVGAAFGVIDIEYLCRRQRRRRAQQQRA